MNLVDSSGWLEYFSKGLNAEVFAPAIRARDQLLVPSICIAEVVKVLLRQIGIDAAMTGATAMRQSKVVDLDFDLALAAAKAGIDHSLPLADSIIFATAFAHGATIWTQDSDFEGLPGVRFVPKPRF